MTRAGDLGPHMPEVLARVAEACGMATALKLAGAFGGGRIYIPESVGEDHALAKALGLDKARKVAALLGHGAIVIPLGPASDGRRRRSEIARMIRAGMSDMEIWRALEPRCHIETIGRVRRSLGAGDPNQPDLFAAPAKRG